MKTKFFGVLVILIGLMVVPVFSSTYYTDEDLSQNKMTIDCNFYYDLGQVTFKIESQQAKSIVLTENTIAYKGGTYTLDIRNLEAGSYKISCYSEELATQVAKFEIKK